LLFFALAGAAGCGSRAGGPETFPVTGEVTLDDRPVPGADVVFFPVVDASDVAPAQAVTDASGRFEVISVFDQGRISRPGMRPGDYLIEVTQLEPHDARAGLDRKPRNLLPGKYSSAALSGLSAKVTSGNENHVVLKLFTK
jgi:hypothetical protein